MAAKRGGNGIADSGVFGLLGTTVQCDADDTSLFCRFAKLMNILVWIIILIGIFYLLKGFIKK